MRNFSLTPVMQTIKCSFSPLHRPPTIRKIPQNIRKLSSFILSLLPCISLQESKLISQELGPRDIVLDLHDLTADWKSMKCSLRNITLMRDSLRLFIPLQVSTFPSGFALDFESLHFLPETSFSDGNTLLLRRKKVSF